jgi:antitoxin PrlF
MVDAISKNSYRGSMKATVSEKGQVTIPKALRQRLGIRSGEVLDFNEENGRLVARKAPRQDPVDAAFGIIRLGRSTDDLVEAMRGRIPKAR